MHRDIVKKTGLTPEQLRHIPPAVWEAGQQLIAAGFTGNLIGGSPPL